MLNSTEKNYLEWLKKAHDDELSSQGILEDQHGAPSTVCFLCQQMAEKFLKCILVFHKQGFPKIHDLLALETQVIKVDSEVKRIHSELVLLNRYYVETRYPGEFPEFSWQDAKEAFAAASRIKKFVLNKVSSG